MFNAGFYYKKYGDRVCCFYCGGRLFQWKGYDNPWYEHAKWFPLCEYLLKKRGVEYMKNVCSKHLNLKRFQIKNPTLSAAANQIRSMLFAEAIQNLDEMMMFDPHVKFAKSIGVKDTKIRHALMQQLEKHNRNFENRQELLNVVMDLNQEDKWMKCKSNEKNAVGMPCGHMIYCWSCLQDTQFCWLCSQRLKKISVCTKPETFFFFCGYKNVHSLESTQHGKLRQPSNELHRQANEIKHPIDYPPYTSCYQTMMEQQQLLSQAKEMESAARDIRTQMKEIAASGLTIPSSTLLRKAVISVKNGKVMFCIDQLSKAVNFLMGNLPHILFRPKSDTKEYVILLFWSTNMEDSECEIQKKFKIIKQEIAVDSFQLRCVMESVPSPRRQFLYLLNNYVCLKAQSDEVCHLPPDNKEQLNNFLQLLKNSGPKRKLANTP